MIARERVSWEVIEGGLTPPTQKSSPIATFYIVNTAAIRTSVPADYVQRLMYGQKKYYRIDLKIEDPMSGASAIWARKYVRASHIVCKMSRGKSYDNRYSDGREPVCEGIHGLIDTPNATFELAEKIRIVMNASMATQSRIESH